MYESPIEIIQKDIVMKQENDIYKAILEQGIVVDKEELIRALQYDRGQYEKGFADGKAAVEADIAKQWEAFKNMIGVSDSPEIVRCKDCKHKGWVQEPCHGKTIDYCHKLGTCIRENDFCSYDERRTDNVQNM